MENLKPISKSIYIALKTWEWMGRVAIVITEQKNIAGDVIPVGSEVLILGKTLRRENNRVTFNSGLLNINYKNEIEIYGVDFSALSLKQ